jgi:hypothetical protein
MAEAKSHLAQCADCMKEVKRLEVTHSMLKASPDVNPPRSVVFEFEKRPVSRFWKWMPAAAAAVLLLAVALAAPVQIRWSDSQLTIAFGTIPTAPVSTAVAPIAEAKPVVVEKAVVQPVDYSKVEQLISNELRKREGNRKKEIQRLQGQLAYLESLQLANERNIMAADSSFQLLAASRAPSER